MITTLIATLALAPVQGGLTCAVMGSPVKADAKVAVDYVGVRYPMCCAGCDGAFKKNPTKFATPEGRAAGYSLYDPVSGVKIDFKKTKPVGPVVSNGVQFYFATQANADAFKADAETFSKLPAKEALYCGVMDHKIDGYANAGAYVDHEGCRYFICCEGCLGKFKAEPAKYAKVAEKAVKTATAVVAKG